MAAPRLTPEQKAASAERRKGRNREYAREYRARRRDDPIHNQKNADGEWRRNLNKYGLTVERFDAMVERQSGRCAICGTGNNGHMRRLCIDHCHTTNTVRGLLCSPCNLMIGHSRDNQQTLLEAAAYLKRTGESAAVCTETQ